VRSSTCARLLELVVPLWGWVALAVALGVATILSGVGLMSTSAYIISAAALHPSIAALEVAIVGVRFFGVSRGVFRYLERYVSHNVALRVLARLRVWFYAALEPLAPARLARYRSGDLLARVVADVETLEHVFVRVIAPPIVAMIVTMFVWLGLARFSISIANAVLGFLLLGGAVVPLLAYLLGSKAGARAIEVRARLSTQIVDGVQGMADLLVYGREREHLSRVHALGLQLARAQRRAAWVRGLMSALETLFTNLALLMVLVIATPLVVEGRLAGVYLAVLALAAAASFESVMALPEAMQHLEASLAAARRLYEIVDAAPAVQDVANPRPVPTSYTLEIRDVRFRYAPGAAPALDGVTFSVPQGHLVAVVGPSGAGKSTLSNLLLRFWDAQEGEMLLGGTDIRQLRQDDLRRLIGVVEQRTHLFNTTLRENLRMARPGAADAEIEETARQAQLIDVIERLPLGLDTMAGERASALSGGERQRVAIARALLKDAPLLLLDEPTANLDAVTEREVLNGIWQLARGRTTLLITHRLAGLEHADEIIVLDHGRIVERGAQRDLLQLGGLYRRLYDAQRETLRDSMPSAQPEVAELPLPASLPSLAG